MKRIPTQEKTIDGDNLMFHPYNIIMVLMLAGVTMLFLALSAAYIYNRIQRQDLAPIHVPVIFLLNTLVLLTSSYMMVRAKKYYQEDNTEAYQKSILITILLSLLFLALQFGGWKTLFDSNIGIAHSNLASYLYVLSGLHFLHVIAGLPFLALFYKTSLTKMKEPVSVLIYFSDPLKKLKLRLLSIYWHFLDILWVYLILFLWINEFIK